MSKSQRFNRGFTLIEVLVTITVIGILAGLVLTAVNASRQAAQRVACTNNLRQLALAVASYSASHQQILPNAAQGFSVHAFLLPHVEQQPLYHSINFQETYYSLPVSASNGTARETRLALWTCPSDSVAGALGRVSYAGNAGIVKAPKQASDGCFNRNGMANHSLRSFTDGTSTTVAFSEWAVGEGDLRRRARNRIVLDIPTSPKSATFFTDFVRTCQHADPWRSDVGSPKAEDWLNGNPGYTYYSHTMPISAVC